MSCSNRVKQQFGLRSFGLKHDYEPDFVQSQWNFLRPQYFSIYRVVVCILLLIGLIVHAVFKVNKGQKPLHQSWLPFFTAWNLIIWNLTHISLTIATVTASFEIGDKTRVVGYQYMWLMYIVSSPSMLVGCILHWGILCASSSFANPESCSDAVPAIVHSLAPLIILLDVMISAIPWNLFQFVYMVIYELVYILFTYIFWQSQWASYLDPGMIYKLLRWSLPLRALVFVFTLIGFSILCHIILFLLAQLRLFLYRRTQVRYRNSTEQWRLSE